MSVRDSLRKFTARKNRGGGGKCQLTDSIGSDGDGSPWKESIGLAAFHCARDLQTCSEKEVENVGERTPSDPMEMGCFDKASSDAPLLSLRDTWKIL